VKERPDDIVQARTQSAARNDPGARLLRIEKQLRPRPGQLELNTRIGADLDPVRNANVIAGRVIFRGGDARFAECGRVHRKSLFACASLPDIGFYSLCSELRPHFDSVLVRIETRQKMANIVWEFHYGGDAFGFQRGFADLLFVPQNNA
jgi:hypothetical protein